MQKESDLDYFVTHVRQNIIDLLVHPGNSFEKREYRAVCNLLWMIDRFPAVSIDPIRIGLSETISGNLLEWIIEYTGDGLRLGLEGIERSDAGSDSFERYLNYIDHPKHIDILDLELEYENFDVWFKEFQRLVAEKEINVNIENIDPYFVFSNIPDDKCC